MPLETRDVGAWWSSPTEEIGRTDRPPSSIRKGTSSVSWPEPRYFSTRSRRVEIWSLTRWSRVITQSEMYSSSPWRVRPLSPRSAVTIAVTPFSFSQRNNRRSSARRMPGLGSPAKRTSRVSIAIRLAPIESMANPIRMKRPSRSYSPDSSISLRSMRT